MYELQILHFAKDAGGDMAGSRKVGWPPIWLISSSVGWEEA